MNKPQAEATFREHYLPAIKRREAQGTGTVDRPGRAEEWGIFTDTLCKGGLITSAQYANWVSPRWLFSARI